MNETIMTNELEEAMTWLRTRRQDAPADADIWHLCHHREAVLPALRQQLMTGTYRLSPMQVTGNHEKKVLWSASDALVLKWVTQRLTPLLPVHPRCEHVKGHGGGKASVVRLSDALASGEFRYVFRTDIRGYYGATDKSRVMAQLRQYVDDPVLLDLVEQYLHYTVEDGGDFHTPEKGIARSCPLSPLIGAFHLYTVDEHFAAQKNIMYARYMDDFVILTKSRWALRRHVRTLNRYLAEYGFEKHPDKTFVGRVEKGFDWLGAWLGGTGVTGIAPRALANHRETVRRLYERLRKWPRARAHARVSQYRNRWNIWARALVGEGATSRRGRTRRNRLAVMRSRPLLSMSLSIMISIPGAAHAIDVVVGGPAVQVTTNHPGETVSWQGNPLYNAGCGTIVGWAPSGINTCIGYAVYPASDWKTPTTSTMVSGTPSAGVSGSLHRPSPTAPMNKGANACNSNPGWCTTGRIGGRWAVLSDDGILISGVVNTDAGTTAISTCNPSDPTVIDSMSPAAYCWGQDGLKWGNMAVTGATTSGWNDDVGLNYWGNNSNTNATPQQIWYFWPAGIAANAPAGKNFNTGWTLGSGLPAVTVKILPEYTGPMGEQTLNIGTLMLGITSVPIYITINIVRQAPACSTVINHQGASGTTTNISLGSHGYSCQSGQSCRTAIADVASTQISVSCSADTGSAATAVSPRLTFSGKTDPSGAGPAYLEATESGQSGVYISGSTVGGENCSMWGHAATTALDQQYGPIFFDGTTDWGAPWGSTSSGWDGTAWTSSTRTIKWGLCIDNSGGKHVAAGPFTATATWTLHLR